MDAKIKTIKIELTEQEHTELKNQANQKRCSLKHYTKTKLMDTHQGIEMLKQEIMQTMPRYCHCCPPPCSSSSLYNKLAI